jgi:hypothetical protein
MIFFLNNEILFYIYKYKNLNKILNFDNLQRYLQTILLSYFKMQGFLIIQLFTLKINLFPLNLN